MKKKILSILLVLCVMAGCVPLALQGVKAETTPKKITEYEVGNTFEFGWYPQSEVKDGATKTALNEKAGVSSDIKASTASWTSYGYYDGTGSAYDGQMKPNDYMRYTDVIYNGNKYRGVVFDSYRPVNTSQKSSSDMNKKYTSQDENGYAPNTVYWFKYEPITWLVLDPATGMVMSDTLLDSQAFDNYILQSGFDYYGEPDENGNKYYANDYEHSSIRAWLNDDFYNTAFSGSQQNTIAVTEVKTQKYGEDSPTTTNDKIYLLSKDEAQNAKYGLGEKAARTAQGSDYAKSQGLRVSTSGNNSGKSYWRLRSAGLDSSTACRVLDVGSVDYSCSSYFTDYGVRPAFNFDTDAAIVQQPIVKEKISDYFVGDTFEFGWYPQSKVEDNAIEANLNKEAEVETNGTASWTSYGYYSELAADDYMRYTDVIYNGSKYRGVVFDTYRPISTLQASSSNMNEDSTYQDENDYEPNNVYWFKYEPITWQVLDPGTGMVMSKTILDSQAFNNYIIYDAETDEYYGNESMTYFANDYENSSIRAWLNDDFINTAFSGSQQNIISETAVETKKFNGDSSTTTKDKIYLLSKDEAENANYGLGENAARIAQSSDYAKSQGQYVSTSEGNSSWRLRSAGYYSYYTCGVYHIGDVRHSYSTYYTGHGVRLAFNFNPASAITQSDVTEVGVAKYTVETYTMKTDGEYEKTTASFTGGIGKAAKAVYTVPAGFALGTNSVTEGEILSNGSLVLKVYLNRNKYTLTTNVDGVTAPYEFYYGQTVSGIPDPAKQGFAFAGWLGEIPTTMPAEPVTVTAQFTENSGYTVKFNTDGGNEIADKTGVKWTDKVLSGVQTPVKAGYTFVGWYVGIDAVGTDSQYKDLVANDTVTEITVTARWKDAEAPVISGIENGTAYCIGKTFTVSDNVAVTSVTANGKELTPDFAGKYTLDTASGETQIVASDAEGNKTSVTVTVNDHNYEWGECTDCGEQDPDMCPFFRFMIDFFKWIIKIMNDFVVWVKALPEAFIGLFR